MCANCDQVYLYIDAWIVDNEPAAAIASGKELMDKVFYKIITI